MVSRKYFNRTQNNSMNDEEELFKLKIKVFCVCNLQLTIVKFDYIGKME